MSLSAAVLSILYIKLCVVISIFIFFGAASFEYITPFSEAKAAKSAEITAGYDAAVAASLTMPTASPTEQDITIGAAAFAAEDAEGLAYIMQTHAAHRNELLAAVDAATTAADVQAIIVSYAV